MAGTAVHWRELQSQGIGAFVCVSVCVFVCASAQAGKRRNFGFTSWGNLISFVPNKKNNTVKMEIYSAVLFWSFFQSVRAGLGGGPRKWSSDNPTLLSNGMWISNSDSRKFIRESLRIYSSRARARTLGFFLPRPAGTVISSFHKHDSESFLIAEDLPQQTVLVGRESVGGRPHPGPSPTPRAPSD